MKHKFGFVGGDNMWFWWFMLVSDLLVPAVMIVGGRMMWRHCPKRINGIIGYRTSRSMKNTDTWKFAHNYCGRLWWKIGFMMLIPSFLIQFPFIHSRDKVIGTVGGVLIVVQCIILIGSVFSTELALKNMFRDDGTRR